QDIPALETALGQESHRWVKNALRNALASLRSTPESVVVRIDSENEEERMIQQIYAEALEDTTHQIVHEVSAIIGRLDVHAASEFEHWQTSKTKSEWSRLQKLLAAIDRLSQVA